MAMAQPKGTKPKTSEPKASEPRDELPAGGTPRAGSEDAGAEGASSSTMGYEEARAALADVVAALESGDATLEEALTLWEQGERYAVVCETWLAGAEERLSKDDRSAPEE